MSKTNWDKIEKLVELNKKNDQLILECQISKQIINDILEKEFFEGDNISLNRGSYYNNYNDKEHIHLRKKDMSIDTLEKISDKTGWILLGKTGNSYTFSKINRIPADILLGRGERYDQIKKEILKYVDGV